MLDEGCTNWMSRYALDEVRGAGVEGLEGLAGRKHLVERKENKAKAQVWRLAPLESSAGEGLQRQRGTARVAATGASMLQAACTAMGHCAGSMAQPW